MSVDKRLCRWRCPPALPVNGFDCTDGCGQQSCVHGGTALHSGVIFSGHEYQRYETGAIPTWLLLRFRGQHHDIETDIFENWRRFCNPSTGRHLQPEPMLKDSEWLTLGENLASTQLSCHETTDITLSCAPFCRMHHVKSHHNNAAGKSGLD